MVVFQAIASSGKVDGKVIEEESQVGGNAGYESDTTKSEWKRSERRFSWPVADQLLGRNTNYRRCVANIFSSREHQHFSLLSLPF